MNGRGMSQRQGKFRRRPLLLTLASSRAARRPDQSGMLVASASPAPDKHAFTALDTTRIYAAPSRSPYEIEDRLMRRIGKKILLNRVAGGPIEVLDHGTAFGGDVVFGRDRNEMSEALRSPSETSQKPTRSDG